MNNNDSGFSLIELSIVLIIVGLLFAGIICGSNLIKRTELQSVMSEIRNYQTAINTYYATTGEFPGAGSSTQMDFVDSCSAWAAMASGGVIDNKLPAFSVVNGRYICPTLNTDSVFTESNSVASKLKSAFYALGYNDNMAENVIFIIGSGEKPSALKTAQSPTASKTTVASITRKDAQFLDDKMDNGVIDSGKIFSFSGGVSGACSYDTSNQSIKDCATAISLGL